MSACVEREKSVPYVYAFDCCVFNGVHLTILLKLLIFTFLAVCKFKLRGAPFAW